MPVRGEQLLQVGSCILFAVEIRKAKSKIAFELNVAFLTDPFERNLKNQVFNHCLGWFKLDDVGWWCIHARNHNLPVSCCPLLFKICGIKL